MTLLLSRTDLESLVDVAATLESLERAFREIGTGAAEQPPAMLINGDGGTAKFLVLAAVSHALGIASTKTFADVPENGASGLPRQRSLITLVSAATGEPLAVLDGRVPTRERTAATTAVATKFLSRDDSTVLALVGAGGLAAPHIRSIMAVRSIRSVRVWSRNPERVAALQTQFANDDVEIVACLTPQLAVAGSDIVCTLTPATEPVVRSEWFGAGVHINAVGAPPRLAHREIDTATMARASVIVDDVAGALHKSGAVATAIAEGAFGEDHVSTTLSDVIVGRAVGRSGGDDVTLFNSVGTGIQDLAIGTLYFERAVAQAIGTHFTFSN